MTFLILGNGYFPVKGGVMPYAKGKTPTGIRFPAGLRFLVVKEAQGEAVNSSREVFDLMREEGRADREIFFVLHLNVKNQVIEKEINGVGTVDGSAVYPREVMRSALLNQSAGLIFAHNHPSGDPEPSLADREITRDLVLAAGTLQIKVLDHVILGRDRWFSFADHGLIEDYSLLGARR